MALVDPTAPRINSGQAAYGGLTSVRSFHESGVCTMYAPEDQTRSRGEQRERVPEVSPGTEVSAKSNGRVIIILSGRAG